MVEKTDRSEDANGPRSADGRRFEVFVREEESDPLRHVGTVAASTSDVAHEEASKLFAWYARDVWVCPAAEVSRYSAESLVGDEDEGTEDSAESDDADEPRVYEETEGTPTVSCGGAPVDSDGGGDEAAEPSAEGSR
ncbi:MULTISPECIES: Htur_1727 family rSAM-partnered candidate RiPP [Halorubrum]|uniref:Htur_1727 family rSAM-partnered candidate RiPP n=1 Tax=Halorubrum ruber TaxID=2982524 RepID=A0A8T8LQK8_9EURY|nr:MULTISPECIES: Htur_1727 family rSAM-partnered candidate RiPP [Halorubrum]QUO48731.1 Htur_1727 family rSAM-partnered candidate RiPP [Halorubrum ruber]